MKLTAQWLAAFACSHHAAAIVDVSKWSKLLEAIRVVRLATLNF